MISIDHFLDMDYKKVQDIGGGNVGFTEDAYHLAQSSNYNNKSSSVASNKWPITSSNYTTSGAAMKHGSNFPYTTSAERRHFVLQHLRNHPFNIDDLKPRDIEVPNHVGHSHNKPEELNLISQHKVSSKLAWQIKMR